MSNSIQILLNQIIKQALPEINSGIQNEIKSNHLDPWGQVAHGSDRLGSINLGICEASANADYNVNNLRGLSSVEITNLEITSVQSQGNKFVGTVNMSAFLRANLSANVGGGIEAQCGFLHPHVGISGSVNVSGTQMSGIGTFEASMDGDKVCLDSIVISRPTINFDNIDVHIDGLGIFNTFLHPLEDLIVGLFKTQISSAVANAVTPLVNNELKNVLSQCLTLA